MGISHGHISWASHGHLYGNKDLVNSVSTQCWLLTHFFELALVNSYCQHLLTKKNSKSTITLLCVRNIVCSADGSWSYYFVYYHHHVRAIGPSADLRIGPLAHWLIGPLAHRPICALAHWLIGPLAHWPCYNRHTFDRCL